MLASLPVALRYQSSFKLATTLILPPVPEIPCQDHGSPAQQAMDKQGLLHPRSLAGEAAMHSTAELAHLLPSPPCWARDSLESSLPSLRKVATGMLASGRWFPQKLSAQCCWVWR